MNQKDYKAIAEIISNHITLDGSLTPAFVTKLADYFEKEDVHKRIKEFRKSPLVVKFNREQFLKDCGVK